MKLIKMLPQEQQDDTYDYCNLSKPQDVDRLDDFLADQKFKLRWTSWDSHGPVWSYEYYDGDVIEVIYDDRGWGDWEIIYYERSTYHEHDWGSPPKGINELFFGTVDELIDFIKNEDTAEINK